MSLARNSGWALLASAGTAPVVLGSSVVLARSLEPAAHGQVQAALSLAVLCTTVGNAGFVAATIQRLQRAGRPASEAWGTGLLGVTIAGGALLVLGLLTGPFVRERLLLGASPVVLGAVLLVLLPTLWASVGGALARGLDRFAVWTTIEWTSKAGRLVLWGVLWGLGLATAESILVAAVAVEVLSLGVASLQLRDVGCPRTSAGELGAAARFGLPAAATTLGGQLHERVDLFLLALLRGDPVEVAVYAVAVAVINRLRVVPLALASALYPRVAGASREEGVALSAQACRVSLAGSLSLAILVLAVAPWAMPWLFGPAYGAAVPLMVVLAPATLAYGVYLVLARWFQGVDQQRVNVGSLVVAGGLNVALNFVLIPKHGAMGAAVASLISYLAQAVVTAWVFTQQTGVVTSTFLVVRVGDVPSTVGRSTRLG